MGAGADDARARICRACLRQPLHAAGLPEFVCASAEDYVDRAIAFGRDRASLAPYRDRLASGRGTALLFDTPRLVRELEALFHAMWGDSPPAGCRGRI